MAFVTPIHLHSPSTSQSVRLCPRKPLRHPQRIAHRIPTRRVSCSQQTPPESSTEPSASPMESKPESILTASQQSEIVAGTMLENRSLSLVYSSFLHGFSNVSFFDRLLPLGGVPSLVLGVTDSNIRFGGYTANGFLARDDYRQSSKARAMFVFAIRDGDVVVAENTDPIQYDFYDYAIRFGSALLGMPMNPDKHIMKANRATSNCRMSDGTTSLFGEFTMATVERLEVFVAKDFVDELEGKKKEGTGFFSRFFGS